MADPRLSYFILGCQRSGTTMLLDVLGRAPEVRAFGEGESAAMDARQRLRPGADIDALIRADPRIPVFKPICESQHGDALLRGRDGSRVLWLFRHYADVARSFVAKWPTHLTEVMDRFRSGDSKWLDWRGERLTDGGRRLLEELNRPGLSEVSAAALFWCVRNTVYFERGLDGTDLAQLARYEDLVAQPQVAFGRVFAFVGVPFDAAYSADVAVRGRPDRALEGCDPAIERACEDLLARLTDAAARGALGSGG